MVRIAALLLLIGGAFVAVPAAAQFGNIFGDAPPRPPADIPGGSFPQQPPPVQYPGQAPRGYPGQPAPGYYPPPSPPGTVETQPLPSPPGASTAPSPSVQGPSLRPPGPSGRSAAAPPASNAPASTPPPAAEAPPPDDTVVEAPTPHIDNGKAVFSGLDKITGRTTSFDVAIGETVQFGALQVTPRACYTRPPTEATNTDAFVEVDEVTLQGEIKRIFTGWMFASSPGLHAVEHPIYDVWLTDCASPQQIKVAEPAVKPPPTPAPGPAPKPRPPAPPARQRPAPPLVPAAQP
jgi:hypothetical protein